jgi:hypothetical protein
MSNLKIHVSKLSNSGVSSKNAKTYYIYECYVELPGIPHAQLVKKYSDKPMEAGEYKAPCSYLVKDARVIELVFELSQAQQLAPAAR